jgi:hypothetical protein
MNKYSIYLVLATTVLFNTARAATLNDPTRPSSMRAPAVKGPETIHVEAIVISASGQWAIVNGNVVRRGDHVADALIEEITRYNVRYTRNGRSEVAYLAHATLPVRRNNTSHED